MAKRYFKNHSSSLPISENQDVFKISSYYSKNVKMKQPTTNAREGEGKWSCHLTLVELKTDPATMQLHMQFPENVKIK